MNKSLAFALALGALTTAAAPAHAAPTEAQKEAIRANCVADFRAHCKGVTPGGLPALECLDKNVASLSPACQTAVKAVESGTTSN